MNFGIENEQQEFKESSAQLDKAIKSLIAMVNKNGRELSTLELMIMAMSLV